MGENARRKHTGETSSPIPKPNAAEGEFMSNAAIGCLSFRAPRSERHRRPTAAEHSFGSSLFKRVTQTVRDYLLSGRFPNSLRGMQTVREAFSWFPDAKCIRLPDVVGRSKMNNSLRQ